MSMQHEKITGIIATKNPTSNIFTTINSLLSNGANEVIIVNDGSNDKQSLETIEKIDKLENTLVINLTKNIGKANALRIGYDYIEPGSIIVQTDDDTISGNLLRPAQLIINGKADIVDVRVETHHSKKIIGIIQQIDYWLINFMVKRIQDWLRSRLWLSGASLMYSYDAGKILLTEKSYTITEDTEGLFRARNKGMKIRYWSKDHFITMVPEDLKSLRKQWQRWSLGNAQVIGIYGLGGNSLKVFFVNLFSWLYLLIIPIVTIEFWGLKSSLFWLLVWSIFIGLLCAIRLKRFILIFAGLFIPIISIVWAIHAIEGLFKAFKNPINLYYTTWVSPKRSTTF